MVQKENVKIVANMLQPVVDADKILDFNSYKHYSHSVSERCKINIFVSDMLIHWLHNSLRKIESPINSIRPSVSEWCCSFSGSLCSLTSSMYTTFLHTKSGISAVHVLKTKELSTIMLLLYVSRMSAHADCGGANEWNCVYLILKKSQPKC